MSRWNVNMPDAEFVGVNDIGSPQFTAVVNEVVAQPLSSWVDVPLYWSLAWGHRRLTLDIGVLRCFAAAFADPRKTWLFANAKFDAHMLANVGVQFAGRLVDVQVMHALLYEERSHALKDIAMHLLQWRWRDFQDTFGKITNDNTAEMLIRRAERENFPLLVEYAANDAWGTLQLFNVMREQLRGENTYSLYTRTAPFIRTLWDLFWNVEVPYTKVLFRNERNGVKINRPYLESVEPRVVQQMDELDKQLARDCGFIVNVDRTDDILKVMHDVCHIRSFKMTKGGKSGTVKESVSKDVLERFADEYPVIELVQQRKKVGTFYKNFLTKIQRMTDPADRVHTRFNQDVARTGRLSSSAPNLQNIPTLENDVWELRKAFIPEPGNVMIAADYNQLEMRLLAAASLDPKMIGVFERGWDIHMGTASMMFGHAYERMVEAKAIDKLLKAGKIDPLAVEPWVHECLKARKASKAIGFGQRNVRPN
jgi:DNA polymerase-1